MLANPIAALLIAMSLFVNVADSNSTNFRLESFHELLIENSSSIFFLETSPELSENGQLLLKGRLACAVESASIHHQNRVVYLIYITSNLVKTMTYNESEYFNVLRAYKNIKIVQASIHDLLNDTAVKSLIPKIINSPHRSIHLSDIVRVSILCKFGGIYFDNDVIVLKSFDKLSKNFVAATSETTVLNNIMGFQEEIIRETFLYTYLVECGIEYSMGIRDICGRILLTRLIKQICKQEDIGNVINKNCSSINILDKNKFSAISFDRWPLIFESKVTQQMLNNLKDSYALHLWNSNSQKQSTLIDLDSAYFLLIKEHCPKTYEIIVDSWIY